MFPVIQGKFDVTEFVGGISEKLIAESKQDAGRACIPLDVSYPLSNEVASR